MSSPGSRHARSIPAEASRRLAERLARAEPAQAAVEFDQAALEPHHPPPTIALRRRGRPNARSPG